MIETSGVEACKVESGASLPDDETWGMLSLTLLIFSVATRGVRGTKTFVTSFNATSGVVGFLTLGRTCSVSDSEADVVRFNSRLIGTTSEVSESDLGMAMSSETTSNGTNVDDLGAAGSTALVGGVRFEFTTFGFGTLALAISGFLSSTGTHVSLGEGCWTGGSRYSGGGQRAGSMISLG